MVARPREALGMRAAKGSGKPGGDTKVWSFGRSSRSRRRAFRDGDLAGPRYVARMAPRRRMVDQILNHHRKPFVEPGAGEAPLSRRARRIEQRAPVTGQR